MMNLIQRFLSKDRSNKSQIRKNFRANFFSLPEHRWIVEGCNTAHFDKLFSHLPANLLNELMTTSHLRFVPSSELAELRHLGPVSNTIVVFPEFQALLKSDKRAAVAYLAHEIAFLLLELDGVTGESIMAEVTADKFVADLGLTFELEDLLLMLDESLEKRVRLTYLTAHHFQDL